MANSPSEQTAELRPKMVQKKKSSLGGGSLGDDTRCGGEPQGGEGWEWRSSVEPGRVQGAKQGHAPSEQGCTPSETTSEVEEAAV